MALLGEILCTLKDFGELRIRLNILAYSLTTIKKTTFSIFSKYAKRTTKNTLKNFHYQQSLLSLKRQYFEKIESGILLHAWEEQLTNLIFHLSKKLSLCTCRIFWTAKKVLKFNISRFLLEQRKTLDCGGSYLNSKYIYAVCVSR